MRKMAHVVMVLIVILVANSNCFSGGTGDIQVYCEPGVQIYIDDRHFGITNEFDEGLYAEGLTPGNHSLKAVKDGYKPAYQKFEIKAYQANKPITLKFEEIKHKVRKLKSVVEETVAKVGSFELMSAPEGAKVYIDGELLGESNIAVDDINIGVHSIKFEKKGRILEGDFFLRDGEVIKLKAHFKKNKIIDISKIERADLERERLDRETKERLEKAKRIMEEEALREEQEAFHRAQEENLKQNAIKYASFIDQSYLDLCEALNNIPLEGVYGFEGLDRNKYKNLYDIFMIKESELKSAIKAFKRPSINGEELTGYRKSITYMGPFRKIEVHIKDEKIGNICYIMELKIYQIKNSKIVFFSGVKYYKTIKSFIHDKFYSTGITGNKDYTDEFKNTIDVKFNKKVRMKIQEISG